jgi:hypothetical protein
VEGESDKISIERKTNYVSILILIQMHTDPTLNPSKGTSLFRGEKPSYNSCALHQYRDQWDAYAYGYRWAVDALFKEAREGVHPTDVHYYPIIFVFRHYLEIRFKGLIKDLTKYVHPERFHEEKIIHGHEIASLWGVCKKLLIDFSETDDEKINEGDLADFKLIEGFIKEISVIDPRSESFRYPVDKNGKFCIDGDKVGPIDMDHFSEIATWMIDYLEGVSVAIDEIYQQRCEILYEIRQEEIRNADFDPGDCYP